LLELPPERILPPTMTSAERRRHPRHHVPFPVRIDTPDKQGRVGMAENASMSGMLLGTQSQLAPGQDVIVRFRIRLEQRQEMTVRAKVVRVSIDEERDLFRRMTALEFLRPVPQLETLLKSAQPS
jgi:hypothetical protein